MLGNKLFLRIPTTEFSGKKGLNENYKKNDKSLRFAWVFAAVSDLISKINFILSATQRHKDQIIRYPNVVDNEHIICIHIY